MLLLISSSSYVNVCISTSEGLSPTLRVAFLLSIGLSILLLIKHKYFKEMVGESRPALFFFRLIQVVIFSAGLFALLQNTVLMEYFVINPNLHPEGSSCEDHNPGPCFGFLGDDYCLKKPPVSVSISNQ